MNLALTNGVYVIVDAEDFDWLRQWNWYYKKASRSKTAYAYRYPKIGGKRCIVWMHREILKPPPHLLTDHINGNGLDNRRENLRVATHRQNLANVQMRPNKTSRYRGVHWSKTRGWVARGYVGGVQRTLGYFKTEEEAGRAYNRVAKEEFGEFARLNDELA